MMVQAPQTPCLMLPPVTSNSNHPQKDEYKVNYMRFGHKNKQQLPPRPTHPQPPAWKIRQIFRGPQEGSFYW